MIGNNTRTKCITPTWYVNAVHKRADDSKFHIIMKQWKILVADFEILTVTAHSSTVSTEGMQLEQNAEIPLQHLAPNTAQNS